MHKYDPEWWEEVRARGKDELKKEFNEFIGWDHAYFLVRILSVVSYAAAISGVAYLSFIITQGVR